MAGTSGACSQAFCHLNWFARVRVAGQTPSCNTKVRTTHHTHHHHHQVPISLKSGHLPRCAAQLLLALAGSFLVADGCTRRCWRRHVQGPPPTRAAPALVVATATYALVIEHVTCAPAATYEKPPSNRIRDTCNCCDQCSGS